MGVCQHCLLCIWVNIIKKQTQHMYSAFLLPAVQQVKQTADCFKQRYLWHTGAHSKQNKNVIFHFPNINIFTAVLLKIHAVCPSQWRHYKTSKYQLTVCLLTCHKIPEDINVYSILFHLIPHIIQSIQMYYNVNLDTTHSHWYVTDRCVLMSSITHSTLHYNCVLLGH